MKIFSILFLLLYCYLFLKIKNIKKRLLYTLFFHTIFASFFTMGNFINFGSFSINYTDASLLFLIISFFEYILKKKVMVNKNIFYWFLLLCFLIIISWIKNSIFNGNILVVPMGIFWDIKQAQAPIFSFMYISYFIRIIFFILVLLVIKNIITREDILYLKDLILKVGKFVLIFGAFEFIIKNISPEIFKIVINLIFTGNTSNYFISSRGGINPILGFSFEPSMFVWSNLFFGLILLSSNDKKKIQWFLLVLIELFVSMSFMSVLVILLLLFYSIFNLKGKERLAIFILIFLFCLLLYIFRNSNIIHYYIQRVLKSQNTLLSNDFSSDLNSEIRLQTIKYTLSQFIWCPLIGTGLGTAYAYSCITTYLTSIGIVGFFILAYIITYFSCFSYNKISISFIIIIVIALFFAGSIADLYTFILPFTMIISNYKYKEEQNDRSNNFKLFNL